MQKHLDRLYTTQPRRFAFTARTLEEHNAWQSAFRAALLSLLGIAEHAPAPLTVQEIYHLDRGSYFEQKLYLDVGEGVQTPLYLLIPKTEPPYPPVLVFHGRDIWLFQLVPRFHPCSRTLRMQLCSWDAGAG